MTQEIIVFFLIGGLAQLVDGALGMAFGVISTSLLLSFGITPAVTSATVHVCKIATGAASGFSHLALGNVDRRLLLQLALPGAIGAMIGAYVLDHAASGDRAAAGRRLSVHHGYLDPAPSPSPEGGGGG